MHCCQSVQSILISTSAVSFGLVLHRVHFVWEQHCRGMWPTSKPAPETGVQMSGCNKRWQIRSTWSCWRKSPHSRCPGFDETASTYVVRQADKDLYQSLKLGMFCYVLNSRQMGKSSLRVRTMAKLKRDGMRCIAFEMRELCVHQVTEDEFYGGFVSHLVSELNLDIDLEEWWRRNSFIHPSLRLSKFVEEILLQGNENIIIFSHIDISSFFYFNMKPVLLLYNL